MLPSINYGNAQMVGAVPGVANLLRRAKAMGNAGHSGVEPKRDDLLFGGRPLLCRGFVVEVQDDHIIVRVTGTSYAASYYPTENSNDLLVRRLLVRDDIAHR